MPLYAFGSRDSYDRVTTNVCAGDEKEAFAVWVKEATHAYVLRGMRPQIEEYFEAYRSTTVLESVSSPEFKGLKHVRIFSHIDEQQQAQFIAKHGIKMLSKQKCMEYQTAMFEGRPEDQWINDTGLAPETSAERITIGDVIGGIPEKLAEKPVQGGKTPDASVGGEESIMGVMDIRKSANEVNLIATYKPIKLIAVFVDNVTDDECWQTFMEKTGGECCYNKNCVAVPERHLKTLKELFPDVEPVEIIKKDHTWVYDYITKKNEEANTKADAIVAQNHELRLQSSIQNAMSVLGVDSIPDDTTTLSEEAKMLLDAVSKLVLDFRGRASQPQVEHAVSTAVTLVDGNDTTAVLNKARDLLFDMLLGAKEDPSAPDADEVSSVDETALNRTMLHMDYMPGSVVEFLESRGYADQRIDCYDYPEEAMVAGNITLPAGKYEIPFAQNARLCATLSMDGGNKTMIYRRRNSNEPAHIVVYRPNTARRFEIIRA